MVSGMNRGYPIHGYLENYRMGLAIPARLPDRPCEGPVFAVC